MSNSGLIIHLDKQFEDCHARNEDIVQYLKSHNIDKKCRLNEADLRAIRIKYNSRYGFPNVAEYSCLPPSPPALTKANKDSGYRSPSFLTAGRTHLPATNTPETITEEATTSAATVENTTKPPIRKGPGRPKGSKNRDKNAPPPVKVPKKRGRPLGSLNKPKDPNAPPKVQKPPKKLTSSSISRINRFSPGQEETLLAAAKQPIIPIDPLLLGPVAPLAPYQPAFDIPPELFQQSAPIQEPAFWTEPPPVVPEEVLPSSSNNQAPGDIDFGMFLVDEYGQAAEGEERGEGEEKMAAEQPAQEQEISPDQALWEACLSYGGGYRDVMGALGA